MTYNKLSFATRSLHWITGLLFLIVFLIGLSFDLLENLGIKGAFMNIHKSLALLVLIFALLRMVWRIKEGKITPTRPLPAWQIKVATALHHTLMLITIIMPLSGIIMSLAGGRDISFFGIQVIAGGGKIEWLQATGSWLHHSLPYFILALIVIHILAALKHEYLDKDNTLSRMLGKKIAADSQK